MTLSGCRRRACKDGIKVFWYLRRLRLETEEAIGASKEPREGALLGKGLASSWQVGKELLVTGDAGAMEAFPEGHCQVPAAAVRGVETLLFCGADCAYA